jgi:phosphate/sulfate permease
MIFVDFFLLAIIALFVLALIDLSVGVSNDAVNFLNSAIGSRVASRRTILIVASMGVIVGAMFSSGIMEVARKGIFNPEMFTFADVMVVFLAVMIADVLLLDFFNTFALPTSTTVSIVFELLGAATAVAILHVVHNPDAPPFMEFINGGRALAIIAGIGLSVVVAFFMGTIIQFFSRLVFTFSETRRTAGVRVIWSALSLSAITYFLFIKGLKGASFITPQTQELVKENTFYLFMATFVVSLVVAGGIQRLGKNPLAFVVLAGTFALAMAFASNDLVNFIGVPLAGLESWKAWSASGAEPEQFLMESLREPVRGNNLYLLGAGIVMAVTLWVSSKARSVTQTEVTLGRQDEGSERFRPGPISRGLVRAFIVTGNTLDKMTPSQWSTEIASRFEREDQAAQLRNAPAFDLVRASVNLAVASILIAIATSLKLPLSTTFVSFMVAMGTSLADRAWGRDSAAYRVAGVLSVLSGWFLTAIIAFLIAAFFAVLISTFGGPALAVLIVLVGFALYHTHRYHGTRSIRDQRARARDSTAFEHQIHLLKTQMSELLKECSDCADLAIRGLLEGNRESLDLARRQIGDLQKSCERKELIFVRVLKRVQPQVDDRLLGHLEALACQQDLYQTVDTIVYTARQHVLNAHEQLTPDIRETLRRFNDIQCEMVRLQMFEWETGKDDPAITDLLKDLEELLTHSTRSAVDDLYSSVRPIKFTTLLLTLLTEFADYVRELERARNLWDNYIDSGADPVIKPVT